ncbi:MAG: sodium:proton antiporter [Oligoflexus sp.]
MLELSLLAGLWLAIGVYLVMEKSIVRVIFGLLLVSHAVNLAFFISGGLKRGMAPLLSEKQASSLLSMTDPLPQALILTAIVISFALIFYISVLVQQLFLSSRHDDSAEIGRYM